MFTTYSHLKAEDKYRRDLLRDQSQTGSRRHVGKVVAALVVAGAVALAACGTATETAVAPQTQSVNDVAPGWRPDTELLDQLLANQGSVEVAPAPELGGVAPPSWEPDWSALDPSDPLGYAEPTQGPR